MRFLNSVTVPKCKRGTLWDFFDIHCVAKYWNKRKGVDLLVQSKKFKINRTVLKQIRVKNTKGAKVWILVCFRGSERGYFCFGRSCGVLSMFCTSVVQVDVVEQKNKNEDLTRLTNTHCKSRAHFLMKCAE